MTQANQNSASLWQRLEKNDLEYLYRRGKNSHQCVVMFHGFGANAEDLAGLATELDPFGQWEWIFPEGPYRLGWNMVWEGRAWFPLKEEDFLRFRQAQNRNLNHYQSSEWHAICLRLQNWMEDFLVGKSHVVWGGFSQGAMLASHLLTRFHPKSFKNAGCFYSGALVDRESFASLDSKDSLSSVSFFQSHGLQDDILNSAWGRDLFAFYLSKGASGEWHEFSGGHTIEALGLAKSKKFLEQFFVQ